MPTLSERVHEIAKAYTEKVNIEENMNHVKIELMKAAKKHGRAYCEVNLTLTPIALRALSTALEAEGCSIKGSTNGYYIITAH